MRILIVIIALFPITLLFGGSRPKVNFDSLLKEVKIAIDIPVNRLTKGQNDEMLICEKAN